MTIRVLDMGGKVKWWVTGFVVFVDPRYLQEFRKKFVDLHAS